MGLDMSMDMDLDMPMDLDLDEDQDPGHVMVPPENPVLPPTTPDGQWLPSQPPPPPPQPLLPQPPQLLPQQLPPQPPSPCPPQAGVDPEPHESGTVFFNLTLSGKRIGSSLCLHA